MKTVAAIVLLLCTAFVHAEEVTVAHATNLAVCTAYGAKTAVTAYGAKGMENYKETIIVLLAQDECIVYTGHIIILPKDIDSRAHGTKVIAVRGAFIEETEDPVFIFEERASI
jgi:hypothetical protein